MEIKEIKMNSKEDKINIFNNHSNLEKNKN